MSEGRRIALVAEGPTDLVLIEASLKAILTEPFVLTQLQPETTFSQRGTGWGGVLRWCLAAAERHTGTLEADPTLEGFDLLIIHLDVDVAQCAYADCSTEVEAMAVAQGWDVLPCHRPCPPVADSVQALTQVLHSWLRPAVPGRQTVLCLPAQSTGTWLAAAILPAGHPLLAGTECNPAVEARLGTLSKALKVRKTVREYRAKAEHVTRHWSVVKALCSQAQAFEEAVLVSRHPAAAR